MKKLVVFLCMALTFAFVGCGSHTPPKPPEEPYNTDTFVGFCVMPMEIRDPTFVPKFTYEEAGYFRPHPDGNKQDFHNTKWPANCSTSTGTEFGASDYAYEYEIRINPRITRDTYYTLQKLYSDESGEIYTEQIGSVFCLPLGCSSEAHGDFRINTGNGLPSEHFYYTVRFAYEE